AFRFWNDGEILPEPAYDPFPFEAAQMRQDAAYLPAAAAGPGGPRTDVVDNTEAEPPEIPLEIPPEIPPVVQGEACQAAPTPSLAFYSGVNRHRRYEDEDEEAAPEAGRPSRILLPLLLCILVAIASAAGYKLWKVTREPRWVQVHFDARASSPRELVLSWDAAAPAVAQATRGVLAVTDGPKPVEIQLSPEQVRRGSFSYSPFSDSPSQVDVLFQLRLYDEENQVAADSLRVIGLPSPAPVVAAISAEPAPAPANPPPAGLATGPAVSPPAARHEVQPVIPPGIQRRIRARTVVPVVVQVDESGHVTRAASKVNGHGLVRYLAGEAVKAARLWSFSPARSKEGSPVAATQTISFEFAPAGR
ncbi:MAG TPA: hypothetical protein VKJ01_15205, partial [Candidatus Solibacter sp.]|nr:hypothetical protein [Candidatus Solibacter sp.]